MMHRTRSLPSQTPRRAGIVVVLVALLLPVLLLVVGLGVEVGLLQLYRSQLRTALDAGAKAGCDNLARTDNIGEAQAAAVAVANRYKVANQQLSLSAADVVVGRMDMIGGVPTFVADANSRQAISLLTGQSGASSSITVPTLLSGVFRSSTTTLAMNSVAGSRTVDLVFVLDRSSSMKLENTSSLELMPGDSPRYGDIPWPDSRWMSVHNNILWSLDRLAPRRPYIKVGIATFASNWTAFGVTSPRTSIESDLTFEFDEIEEAMVDLTGSMWNGRTHIEEGMRAGRSLVKTSGRRRSKSEKMMVVLTDGAQTDGDAVDAAYDLADEGIVIHTVTYGNGMDTSMMAEIASIGGGVHFHAANAADLSAIFNSLVGMATGLVQ